MPPARSPQQLGEIASFVHALYEKSGARTWAEFANRAGVHPVQISDYQLGKAEPSGYNLFRLIRAANGPPDTLSEAERLLDQVDAVREQLERAAVQPPSDTERDEILAHLRELQDSVADLAKTQHLANGRLQRIERQLREEPPASERGRKRS